MAEGKIQMNELINVTMNQNNEQTVSARDLYSALEIKQRFSVWFDTNSKYFIEGTDFTTVKTDTEVSNNGGTQLRSLQDYQLTLDMGKQVAMMSRTEKGKQVRAYFIEVEKQFNSPEMMMARSLQYANQTLLQYDKQIKELNTTIEIQAPKVEFAETIQQSESNISVTNLAKLMSNTGVKVGRNKLFEYLRETGWLLRDNTPSQKGINRGLFATHESPIQTHWGTQIKVITDVTPKGQEFFINKLNDYLNEVA